MEMWHATNRRQTDSEENSNIEPKKKTKCKAPTVKMERSAFFTTTEHTTYGLIHEEDEGQSTKENI
jgi:ATP-dependent protease ClpP protease subunit